MNKVILMGRLTRDPDIRYSQDNLAIARFSLAVDRRFKKEGDQQTADFPNCVAFGKTAEFIEKYVKKGTKLCVEGRLQTGSYTNKDGQTVYTTEVVIENAEFAESKASQGSATATPQAPTAPSAPSVDAGAGFMSISDGVDDEGLPFN